MRVLGTVGLPGSGKGEAAVVAEDRGIPVITMGDVIRQACRDRGLDPAEHHGQMAQTLREENGPAAIAERSIPMINKALSDADTVLVDGLRSMVEVDAFESEYGDGFLLVSIEAPFDVRAERLGDRGRDESDGDLEKLRTRDERELELGMGDVIDYADLTIKNTNTLEAFHDQINAIFDGDADVFEQQTETQ